MDMLLINFRLFQLLLILITFSFYSCGNNSINNKKEKMKFADKEITKPELITKNLVGNWTLSGKAISYDGVTSVIKGEFEFKESKIYKGKVSMKSPIDPVSMIIACQVNGKLKNDENMELILDYDYQGNCNCTFEILNKELLTESQLSLIHI